jgi:hypothetical protein
MMEATDVGSLNDASSIGSMDVPGLGAVHVQGEMCAPPVIMLDVFG